LKTVFLESKDSTLVFMADWLTLFVCEAVMQVGAEAESWANSSAGRDWIWFDWLNPNQARKSIDWSNQTVTPDNTWLQKADWYTHWQRKELL